MSKAKVALQYSVIRALKEILRAWEKFLRESAGEQSK